MLGIQTLDIWCRLDFALEMLYVACWREAIKCFTMFSWHLSALLCPGKSNEPRFNTRWPHGLSDVSSFYWTFTFSTWNCSTCKSWLHSAAFKTHQVSWDILHLIINIDIFGNELFGMKNPKLNLFLTFLTYFSARFLKGLFSQSIQMCFSFV